jgi:hypothetical protein
MKLLEFPDEMRRARTEALKWTGSKLKLDRVTKNVRRRVLLELECEIILRMMELQEVHPGMTPD